MFGKAAPKALFKSTGNGQYGDGIAQILGLTAAAIYNLGRTDGTRTSSAGDVA